ncbi:helix-turn-helix domain-containing protein [Nocardia sp. NPDC127606]|uniref:helix-turn-helix domain-containing protein n=1 Tax=Nocardia sp. NPDC127606 TaxID=3345406 RepID=UPI003637FBED
MRCRPTCDDDGGLGEPNSRFSRVLAESPGSVSTVLKHHRGIVPLAARGRAGHLNIGERETISRGVGAGMSFRTIATDFGRSPPTVSREID